MNPLRNLGFLYLFFTFCPLETPGGDPMTQSPVPLAPSTSTPHPSLNGTPNIPTRVPRAVARDESAYEDLKKYRGLGSGRFLHTKFWNTSVQYVIPLFTFSFPPTQGQGSTIELVHQAMYALFILFIITCMFAWPVMVTEPLVALASNSGTGRSRSFGDDPIIDSAPNSVHWLIDPHLANELGLDRDKCFDKTVCQAYESPRKYGILSTILRIFYPQPKVEDLDIVGNRGQKRRRKKCAANYKCFFDILDLIHYFVDWWKLSRNKNTIGY